MATPMKKAEKVVASQGRVVVFIPNSMRFLLDQVSRYLTTTKKSLHEEIWNAGVRAYLGIDPEDMNEKVVTSLPAGTAAPKNAKQLAQALLTDR